MDKSRVATEQKVCAVCARKYDIEAILLDKRLKKSLAQPTVSGTGICPEHAKLHEDGFIALVEIDPEKSGNPHNNIVKQQDAYRTGNIAHIRRDVAQDYLGIPEEQVKGVMMFTEKAVLDMLRDQIPKGTKPN